MGTNYDESLEELDQASKRWRSQWPAHCRTCFGWGGTTSYDNHGLPGPGEQVFDPCPNCVMAEEPRCGRCSYPMTVFDAEIMNPCVACGWNCDDGDPYG